MMETITWVTVISRDSDSLSGNNVIDDYLTALSSHEMGFLLSYIFNDVDIKYFIPSNGDLNYGEIRMYWTPDTLRVWLYNTEKQDIRATYEMDIITHAKNTSNINVVRYVGVEDVVNDPDRKTPEDFVESTIPMMIYEV
jgi:hypothetical protein